MEKFKSGFVPPGDYPFEDLSNTSGSNSLGSTVAAGTGGGTSGGDGGCDSASINGSMSSIQHPGAMIHSIVTDKKSILGTITGGRVRKRSGLLGLFSNTKVKKKL